MFERQSKLKPAHTVRCGLVFLLGGFPIPLSRPCGRQLPLLRGACCGEGSPCPSFIWGCTPYPAFYCGEVSPHPSFCGIMHPTPALTFLIREKSAKAYARGHPLHNPEGETRTGLCVYDTRSRVSPAVTFGHAPPFALRVVSSSARGNVPFRALWGKSTPRSGDVPPRGDFQEDPSS